MSLFCLKLEKNQKAKMINCIRSDFPTSFQQSEFAEEAEQQRDEQEALRLHRLNETLQSTSNLRHVSPKQGSHLIAPSSPSRVAFFYERMLKLLLELFSVDIYK